MNIYLNNKLTAPATTGEATLVPDSERHPPLIKQIVSTKHLITKPIKITYFKLDPLTPDPYVTISGLIRPYPPGNSYKQ